MNAAAQDRTGDLQIFSLTLSQLSYNGQTVKIKIAPWRARTADPKYIST